jgi:hypothetical protein
MGWRCLKNFKLDDGSECEVDYKVRDLGGQLELSHVEAFLANVSIELSTEEYERLETTVAETYEPELEDWS